MIPKYYYRGSYANNPKAPPDERKLQILRILKSNAPKWTKPATVSERLLITMTNAQNLLKNYSKVGLVEARPNTPFGKYKITVYKLTTHGEFELSQLEIQFSGKMIQESAPLPPPSSTSLPSTPSIPAPPGNAPPDNP